MEKSDQTYYILFSVISILLTVAFQVSTINQRQLGLQLIGMPHFLIPTLMLIFSASLITFKKKALPILLSLLLVAIYLYFYTLSLPTRVLAVYAVVVYGLAHVIRDHIIIEHPNTVGRFSIWIRALLAIIILAAAAFSSLNVLLQNSFFSLMFSVFGLFAIFLCAIEIGNLLRKRSQKLSIHSIYIIYVLSALIIWLGIKVFWLRDDFWDLFVYHVIFWYFIYFYSFNKSILKSRLTIVQLAALVVTVNLLYYLGVQYGISNGWLIPIPSLSINGVFSAENAPLSFFSIFDVRMFYAWIIFHVTLSWTSNVRIFAPRKIEP